MSDDNNDKSEWNDEILVPLDGLELEGEKKDDNNYDNGDLVPLDLKSDEEKKYDNGPWVDISSLKLGIVEPGTDTDKYQQSDEERQRLLQKNENLENEKKRLEQENLRIIQEYETRLKSAIEAGNRQKSKNENIGQVSQQSGYAQEEKTNSSARKDIRPDTGNVFLAKFLPITLIAVLGVVSYKLYEEKHKAPSEPQIEYITIKDDSSEQQLKEKEEQLKAMEAAKAEEEQRRKEAEAKAAADAAAREAAEQELKKKQQEEAEKERLALSRYRLGSIISLGRWPIDVQGEDPRHIEWEILEKRKDGTAILLSRQAIDLKPYHLEKKSITWSESSIRWWLNGEFYNKAFTESEKGSIVPARLLNSDNNGKYTQAYIDNWKKWGVYESGDEEKYLGRTMRGKGGETTTDKVWLLSLDDMRKYGRRFRSDTSRTVQPAEYLIKRYGEFCTSDNCRKNGAVGNVWWWLRSPGKDSDYGANVNSGGFVNAIGSNVDNKNGGVRAAIKVNLKKL